MEVTPLKTPLKEKLTNEALMNQCMYQLKINRKGEAALIELLSEIDERKLFAEEGYASMFKFCTGHLHLSEPATYRRIGASRVVRDYPAALEMLSKGEIHMTALNMVRPCLTPDNHLEILRLCKHQTRMEVEVLVAERFPERAKYKKGRKPKAEIRALPSLALGNPQKERSLKPAGPVSESVSESRQPKHHVSAQHELWQKKEEESGSERKQDLANHNGAKKPSPLLQDFRLSVDIDWALQKKLTQAQQLSPFGKNSLQDVLDASLDLFIKDRMKVKFKQRTSCAPASGGAQATKDKKASKATKTTKSTKATSRYIPNLIKREVATRDNFQCTFTSKSGHRCHEKQGLEYHHLQAFSLGGAHTPQNLTLLCRQHNLWDAEKTLGIQVMGRWKAN